MTATAARSAGGWQPPGRGQNHATPLLAALGTVRDPELDEPITALGFVSACSLAADGTAEVRLRLPTYFCAPNFAYLMVADAYDAVTEFKVDGAWKTAWTVHMRKTTTP